VDRPPLKCGPVPLIVFVGLARPGTGIIGGMSPGSRDRAGQLPSDFTLLLRRWQEGDEQASEQVLLTVYREMRSLASRYLRSESREHTLQPTALVHELYVNLLASEPVDFTDRSHFLALCARKLRHILVDYARQKHSQRRGGDVIKLSLEDWDAAGIPEPENLLDLDRALSGLEKEDPRSCQVVELRFFGGLAEDEIAAALNISLATVKRDWTFARAWLLAQLKT
jgi:RNA polymerase sigma factor (TIGR02999 family)